MPAVRTKVSLGRQLGKEDERCISTSAVHGLVVDVRTPPVQRDLLPLHSKEDDDGRKGDTTSKGSGQNIVVLLPPSRLVTLDIPHEGKGNIDRTYPVRQVLWRPKNHTIHDERRVDVLQPRNRREEHRVDDVEDRRREHRLRTSAHARSRTLNRPPSQGEDKAKQEAVLDGRVDLREDSLGTKSTLHVVLV